MGRLKARIVNHKDRKAAFPTPGLHLAHSERDFNESAYCPIDMGGCSGVSCGGGAPKCSSKKLPEPDESLHGGLPHSRWFDFGVQFAL
jgi:hypothetical protein